MNQGIRATSPGTGSGLCDDVTSEVSPHGTGGSPAHRTEPEEADTSEAFHAGSRQVMYDLKHEVQRLRERVERLESMETRLLALEQGQPRLEGPLDILMRM